jgi:predicted membrane-bound spermidine synthase
MSLFLIYAVSIIEGFSTLAVQIIALRSVTPIVGSSIILTSVFIGIILLALSAGYYVGGIISSKHPKDKLVRLL